MIDIYVINLLNRSDRKELMKKKFNKFKNINLIFIEGEYHENGHIGCFRSHKKCIQYAKDNDMDYIMVMEDDNIPCKYFEQRLLNILQYLNNNSFDIFLGAVNKTKKKNIIQNFFYNKEKLLKISAGATTNFIIYNKKIYDFFLSIDENNSLPIDVVWHNKLSAIVCVPFLIYPEKDYSNIEKKYIDYTRPFKITERHLMKEFW